MFGYIRPHKPELLIKEYDAYKSVYCGLCKSLGENFGIISRLTLSYDATFLAMLYISLRKPTLYFDRKRCVVNPAKRCIFCSCKDDIFSFAGAASLIMTYYKIKDDICDSKFLKKIRSYLSMPLVLRGHKKAKDRYPEIEKIIVEFIINQNDIENFDSGIDASAQPTANALSKIFSLIACDEADKRVLEQLGFFMGRWVYLIDAADDIDKDLKTGNFNPFVNDLIMNRNMEKSKVYDYCNQVLNQTLSQAISAFNLLNLSEFKTVLNNIIIQGMPMMQKYILFDKNKDKKVDFSNI